MTWPLASILVDQFWRELTNMTVIVSFEEFNLAVVRASGVLMRTEADSAKHVLHRHMQEHGRIYALIVIEEGFSNLEAFVSWDDIEVDRYLQQNVLRMALVGDLRWRDSALLFFLSAVAKFQMEYFKPEQEELARVWLTSGL